MHRSNSLKRNTDLALPQRHGARPAEHRTGLPYVPSTPSTRSSSSSRSSTNGGELSQPTSWEQRPQLSGVPSLGRQKILPNARSPLRAMRNAASPLRQASPPQYPKGGNRGASSSKPVISHATKEAPPYYDQDDDEWDEQYQQQQHHHPYYSKEATAPPRHSSPSRVTMVMRQTSPTHGPSSQTRRTMRPSASQPSDNLIDPRNRSSNHSSSRGRHHRAPTKEASVTTASLSHSSSSSKRHLLRPHMPSSDASFRDTASFRTNSTGTSSNSGSRLPPSSRNSRRIDTRREEDDDEDDPDAASFNDESTEDVVPWDDAAFHASFVSIDFGSTVGVAPAMPSRVAQHAVPQQYPLPPPEEHPWHQEQDNYYGYGEEEEEDYLDDDDALLFRDAHDEDDDFAPPPHFNEAQTLERAVRRGSSLAVSGYQEAAVLATQLTEVVRQPTRRPLTRSSLSKRHLQGRGKVPKSLAPASEMAAVQQVPPRRSSVSKSSHLGALHTTAATLERGPPREMMKASAPSHDRPGRRSSLQHPPAALAASYRATREPVLARSRSYDDEDFYGLPRGYDVAPPARQRPGLARTLSQPDLFDWKDDIDDMSFSDLAVRHR